MARAYYNDINPFVCKVLRKQIALGNLPPGDVDERSIEEVAADDLRGYTQVHLFAGIGGFPYGLRLAGWPDDKPIWTGGFPCQDISAAGRREGIGGRRSGLWKEYLRLVRALRPQAILVENVARLLSSGLDVVLGDLATVGYDARWDSVPASAVGAPHIRDRVWIVAYPDTAERGPGPARGIDDEGDRAGWQKEAGRFEPGGPVVADTDRERREKQRQFWATRSGRVAQSEHAGSGGTQPDLGGAPHGLSGGLAGRLNAWAGDWEEGVPRTVTGRQPGRIKKLEGLGNAVVPQVVALVAGMIMAGEIYSRGPTPGTTAGEITHGLWEEGRKR